MGTVLLIEDEPDAQKAMARLLQLSGFDVTTASNGAEALSEVDRRNPDVILLDLMMPVMDGKQFLLEYRRRAREKQAPTIVVTALTDGREFDDVQGLGIVGCFTKGHFDPDVLMSSIRRHIGGAKAM